MVAASGQPASLFERWISRPQRPWVTVALAAGLLLAPLVAALLDAAAGRAGDSLGRGLLRAAFLPPVVIVYILAVAPRLGRMDARVLRSLRTIVLIDDDAFARLVRTSSAIQPAAELVVLGSGAVLGLVWVLTNSAGGALSWLKLVYLVSTCLMVALVAWTIYVSIAGTRLAAALYREPLRVDPLDLAPFAAIGQQSLLLALVFVGGITLSLIFVAFEPQSLLLPAFWLTYLPLALVPVLIFFLSMRPTHRLLTSARRHELAVVQAQIARAGRALVLRLEEGRESGPLPGEIVALTAFEARLQAARTWPYNTDMLRTLFFSVLVPGGAMVARLVADTLLTSWGLE